MRIPIRVRAVLATALAGLLMGGAAPTSAPAFATPRSPSVSPGTVLVRFQPGTPTDQMQAAVAAAGGSISLTLPALDAVQVTPTAADFTARVSQDSRVQAAWPESLKRAAPLPRPRSATRPAGAPPSTTPPGASVPDPLHDQLQWDDARMQVPPVWTTTLGDPAIRVAVLDTGVDSSDPEVRPNLDMAHSASFVACTARPDLGISGPLDCSPEDVDGHGTWVAGRIGAAVNGLGSNGVAPNVTIRNYKVLSGALGGFGLDSWILAGLLRACDDGASLVNMSLGGYSDPANPADVQTYLLYVAAVQYCRAKGTAIVASAGNEHVRINRTTLTLAGQALPGVGLVDAGGDGFGYDFEFGQGGLDLRGLLEAPAGVPGVLALAATTRGSEAPTEDVPPVLRGPAAGVGQPDQLAYYSNYGSRIDLAAPAGSSRFNVSIFDGGPNNAVAGWGDFGTSAARGVLCTDPLFSVLDGAFTIRNTCFIWIFGTSMAAPNTVGVAALTLSTHPELRGRPDALFARLQATARDGLTNFTTPLGASTEPEYDGTPCPTGYCHLDLDSARAIRFSDAYGAGVVDAARAAAR